MTQQPALEQTPSHCPFCGIEIGSGACPNRDQHPSLPTATLEDRIAELADQADAEMLRASMLVGEESRQVALEATALALRAWRAERLLREAGEQIAAIARYGPNSLERHGCLVNADELRAQVVQLLEGVEPVAVSQPVHGAERWYLHLLGRVAAELDRLAIGTPLDVNLNGIAMRIRARIHEGPPAGWVPPQQPASEPL